MEFLKACKTVVVPIVAIIVATIVLLALGYKNAAFGVSYGGTTIVMLLNILYIAFWHSRSRWPGSSWRQRLIKLAQLER